MNVLDTGVGKIDLPPEQNADLHVNAFFIEAVLQGVVSKIEVRQTGEDARTGQDGPNDVVFPQRGVGPFQLANEIRDRLTIHRRCNGFLRNQATTRTCVAKELLPSGTANECELT